MPESDFDVMREVWGAESEVNTAYLMEKVGKQRGWKAPTLISFLVRLEERGFVASEKKGKERYYTSAVDREDYLHAVTEDFVKRYHGGSFVALMDSLYRDKGLSGSDLDGMLEWLKTKY
ncbi:MAG: BlaI/MecI/CopY family transcriptional regulator [Clostridia bacterium]|nr:BlaI/MecI/CopY family transcriptional regulator [Clostridia bacterium]